MKVNVIGKGFIRPLNAVLPVYGIDVDKSLTNQLLNYRNLEVYMADRPVRITKANIDSVFNNASVAVRVSNDVPKMNAVHATTAQPAVADVVKEEEKPIEVEQVETPVEMAEEVEAPAIEDAVIVGIDLAQNEDVTVEDEVAEVIEESVTEKVVETTEDTTDEVAEEKPVSYNNKKKNKKNRNNG